MDKTGEIMMTMNSSGWSIRFENTDGMRELFRRDRIDMVLDFHWIPKIWKNFWNKYYGYPIEIYPEQVKIVDAYFEEIMNPFHWWFIESKKFYLLKIENELNDNKWEHIREENDIGRTSWVPTDWDIGTSDKWDIWVEKESEATDRPLNSKKTSKNRWRVKGRRKYPSLARKVLNP